MAAHPARHLPKPTLKAVPIVNQHLQQQAHQSLTQLAEQAHATASNPNNPSNDRFRAHQARDLYRQAISLLHRAAQLAPEEIS